MVPFNMAVARCVPCVDW